MEYELHQHRHALTILEATDEGMTHLWKEIQEVLDGITDDDLITAFPESSNVMSLSAAINNILKDRLVKLGWNAESPIFQDPEYMSRDSQRWRLDFAKDDVSIEVAFNHGEAMAWNLLKPVMASELNHVQKAIQTKLGIIILATEDLKKACAFDGAVGTYEKALRYMKPMNDFLSVPILLIGLKAPKTFRIEKEKKDGRNVGTIIKND